MLYSGSKILTYLGSPFSVLLVHAHHDARHLGAAHDGREDRARGVVASEAGLRILRGSKYHSYEVSGSKTLLMVFGFIILTVSGLIRLTVFALIISMVFGLIILMVFGLIILMVFGLIIFIVFGLIMLMVFGLILMVCGLIIGNGWVVFQRRGMVSILAYSGCTRRFWA